MDRSINGVLEEQWFISRHSLYKLLNRNWCSVRVNYITRSPLECHTICKQKRHLTHRFQGQKSIDLRRRWLRSKAMYMNDLLFTTHFNLAHLRFKCYKFVALRKKIYRPAASSRNVYFQVFCITKGWSSQFSLMDLRRVQERASLVKICVAGEGNFGEPSLFWTRL